jgi:DNA topoisomerase-3
MLTTNGKLVVPTPAGLQLFELLKGAAPALVDPGMTAVWEMRLDEVVTGRVQFKGVIDEIAAEAGNLIAVLRQHTGALVDLSRPAPIAARRARGRARTKRNADKAETDTSGSTRPNSERPSGAIARRTTSWVRVGRAVRGCPQRKAPAHGALHLFSAQVAYAFGVHQTTIYRCLLASDVLRRRPRRTKGDKCWMQVDHGIIALGGGETP